MKVLQEHVDIKARLREEIRDLPPQISLSGNAMQIEVAKRLLKECAAHIQVTGEGEPVQVMSMEQYASSFLESFMEEAEPPQGRFLLYTIPESELILFAARHHIPAVHEPHSAVRSMLDRIAASQPQTYFSLLRSSQRLKGAAEQLREVRQK
jgi:hypothetical protein